MPRVKKKTIDIIKITNVPLSIHSLYHQVKVCGYIKYISKEITYSDGIKQTYRYYEPPSLKENRNFFRKKQSKFHKKT